jgi:hypothetical protein
MDRHQTLCKISHYEWMLESLTLAELHRYWIVGQLQELKSSLAQFHPADHPLNKIKESA